MLALPLQADAGAGTDPGSDADTSTGRRGSGGSGRSTSSQAAGIAAARVRTQDVQAESALVPVLGLLGVLAVGLALFRLRKKTDSKVKGVPTKAVLVKHA